MRYFIAVAEELHFGRASARLHMAQPPLSQQIQRLERELGVTLFIRDRRHVELTEAGKVFLDRARTVVGLADQSVEVARMVQGGHAGKVRVGFVGSATFSVMPSVIARFRDEYPDILLELHEMTTNEQVDALTVGRIDVGFTRAAVASPEHSMKELLDEDFVLAVEQSHPLAARAQVEVSDLRDERLILYPPHLGSGLYEPLIVAFHACGFEPVVSQEAQEMHTILSLVGIGLGLALVPACVQALQWPNVAYCKLAPPVPKTKISIVWHPRQVTKALATFLAQV